MKLIVVSGRSGSGKSTALNALEDQGYNCIDNLPVGLLPALVANAGAQAARLPFAVGIDARNLPQDLERFPEILEELEGAAQGVSVEIIYLDAELTTLVRRFSETRRRHPLTDDRVHLPEALEVESQLLEGIAHLADLNLDTTAKTIHDLRDEIRERVVGRVDGRTAIMFRSFGFRSGVPVDADFVFDVRCLPNPHWVGELAPLTGCDEPVVRWLEASEEVQRMFIDIRDFLTRWLPSLERSNRSYLTIAIGCTGGRHRSVYLADRLGEHFAARQPGVLVRHRESPGAGRRQPGVPSGVGETGIG